MTTAVKVRDYGTLSEPAMRRIGVVLVSIARVLVLLACGASAAFGADAPGSIAGHTVDQTGAALPGVTVEVRRAGIQRVGVTDTQGAYSIERLEAGDYEVTFRLLNFGTVTRLHVRVNGVATTVENATLRLALSADVVVAGKSTFTNLADVENPTENLVGIANAATQGAVTAKQLEARPLLRVGEVLETVPGVVISQHSGEGKANQYYLRGFNLDHGTDFATTVAGMPVNLPSNAHGQGYSDLTFLIPELVSGVQFRKGPYYAEDGDFSSAGSANINYVTRLDHPIVELGGGAESWGRALLASSLAAGSGTVLVAGDIEHDDGPWVSPDHFQKFNGVVRYSRGDALNGFSVTGMGYSGRWNSTDQVPQRAINSGDISRFGAIDRTDGGESSRYSASLEWQRSSSSATTTVSAYAIRYRLNLFSNFTYFLDDPVNGDQFEQADQRVTTGGRISQRRLSQWAGHAVKQTYGVQVRNDDIGLLGLFHTKARVRLSTTRDDAVNETNGGVFYENEVQWDAKLRTIAGVRVDEFRFDVQSNNQVNSGVTNAALVSPKGGVILGPWANTEFYVNGGEGYHSNDARGTTITVDPSSGEPANRVTPLVRSKGAELGVRSVVVPHWQTTLSLWRLDLASELVFSGDAGTTDASRPSRRTGIEWANYFRPVPALTFDGDLATSTARFTDLDPFGNHIPGAVETVASAGVTWDGVQPVFGAVRFRYFGPRPLIEDNSVRSQASSLVNAQVGYRLTKKARLLLDVFNLLNSTVPDIDYYYASRLPGEPLAGVDDIHTHPMQPRVARLAFSMAF
jgi:outer membrane cobalamin receptor